MTTAMARAGHDSADACPAAGIRAAGDPEIPRPLRLLVTAGRSLTESAGLPVAACQCDGCVVMVRWYLRYGLSCQDDWEDRREY
jgi:hypothetical protein